MFTYVCIYNTYSIDFSIMSGDSQASVIGRVKWFNPKQGYGFITVTEGTHSGEDIFVHHSEIQVSKEQFKYLVQGEYVHFELQDAPEESDHSHVSVNVRGVCGGQLMCETNNERREQLLQRKNEHRQQGSSRENTQRTRPRTNMRGRGRGRGQSRVGPPRRTNGQTREEWVLMKRRV